jgi:hypothetical protein
MLGGAPCLFVPETPNQPSVGIVSRRFSSILLRASSSLPQTGASQERRVVKGLARLVAVGLGETQYRRRKFCDDCE